MTRSWTYGQFCPVAQAAEIIAERWTPLVLRELLLGSRRFNDLQRGVPLMPPATLAQRLRELQRAKLVEHREGEYLLTAGGLALKPIVQALGEWGQRGDPIDAATVGPVRAATKDRTRPWTDGDLTPLLGPAGGK